MGFYLFLKKSSQTLITLKKYLFLPCDSKIELRSFRGKIIKAFCLNENYYLKKQEKKTISGKQNGVFKTFSIVLIFLSVI